MTSSAALTIRWNAQASGSSALLFTVCKHRSSLFSACSLLRISGESRASGLPDRSVPSGIHGPSGLLRPLPLKFPRRRLYAVLHCLSLGAHTNGSHKRFPPHSRVFILSPLCLSPLSFRLRILSVRAPMCRATLGAVPQKPSTTLSFEAGSLWVLCELDWLAGHWTPEICFPRTAVTACTTMLAFLGACRL